MSDIQKISWKTIEEEKLSDHNEEYFLVTSGGAQKFIFDDREIVVNAGEVLVIPPNTPHSIVALEDAVCIHFWAPVREDWLRGEDQYLRR